MNIIRQYHTIRKPKKPKGRDFGFMENKYHTES